MQHEFVSLAVMSMFFLVAWFPVSMGKWKSFGFKWLASNRVPVSGTELPDWAARCERAHNNLKDNFPAFVTAILALGVLNKFDNGTALAAVIYTAARIGHYISYGIGNVLARAIFFFSGLIANFYLLIKIFI